MKRSGLSILTGALLCIGSLSAAITYSHTAAAQGASSARSWTGCYLGAHAGALRGRTDHGVDGLPVNPAYQRDVTFSDVTVGAHLGCNYQIDRWILGVEGDLSWTPVDSNIVVYSDATNIQSYRDRLDRYGTIRGRIGIAEGRWHAFATAGVAFSNLEMSFNRFNIDTGILDKFPRKGSNGWVAGAGLEYAVLQDWFARIEYLYHRFDGGLLLYELGPYFVRANDPHFHVVRFGITRKFGSQP
jgi:opacity protein-like surface antigen